MTPKKINQEDLSRIPENQRVEFKTSLSNKKDAMKALNAMVNTDHAVGTVVFGVAPDGIAVGLDGDIDQNQRSVAQLIQTKFDPEIRISIELLDCEGKILISVCAHRSEDVAYHEYDGRAFIREGSINRQLTRKQKDELVRRREGPIREYVPLDRDMRDEVVRSLCSAGNASGITVEVDCEIGDANRQLVGRDLIDLLKDAEISAEGPNPVNTFSPQPLPPVRMLAHAADKETALKISHALLAHLEGPIKGESARLFPSPICAYVSTEPSCSDKMARS